MSSVFNNVSTRMFCIYGELSDVFCMPNGWVMSFEELLVHRLQDLGFGSVVFCSSQRNMFYALNMSGSLAFDVLSGKRRKKKDEPEKKQPEPKANDDALADYGDLLDGLDLGTDSVQEKSPEPEKKQEQDKKIKYTNPVGADQLAVAANRYMQDTEMPRALVFTSLEDLIRLSTTDGGRRILEFFEDWKGLPNENQNICIFLSKTLDSPGLQAMLQENRVAILESLFLKNAEFNSNACIGIGAPMNDEIASLLELLRLEGHTYKKPGGEEFTAKLRFRRSEMEQLVRVLSFCNRGSGFTQLKVMKEILERFMRERGTAQVMLTTEDVIACYPRSDKSLSDEEDPMEILRSRQGWESAYHVLSSFITNYRALYSSDPGESSAPAARELTVSRFEPGAAPSEARGKVPNFVLQGPPGVGKTEIANLIGRILQREGVLKSGHTVIGSRDKLVGEYVGSTAIKTAALIEEAQEGVLLVDEVYSIAEKAGEGSISYCDEVFNTIVAAMTNSSYHFCVIFAGYADRMHEVWEMNEGLYSRFSASNVITLTEYQPELLQKIFQSKFGKPEGVSGQTTILSEDVVEGLPIFFENYFADRDRKNFGNARDINNLVSEVKRSASYRHLLELENRPEKPSREEYLTVTVERQDFEDRLSLFEKRGYSAEDIYSKIYEYEGLEFLTEMFNDQLAIKVECQEKNITYPGPSHMIWAGNPGTGKSTAAQLTADLYHTLGILGGTEPIYVDASEIMSVYASGSADNMRKKMDEACQKNAVLVIEEAYQLLQNGGQDAIHAMLNRMETDRAKFNIILILYRDKVQPFLDQNPGLASRLKVYYFPDYNAQQLFNIFGRMCKKAKDNISEDGSQAVKAYLDTLYASGRTKEGNARIVRQLHEQMKQLRYKRIIGEMAVSLYGEDNAQNRSKAAAARAMGTAKVPESAYTFTAADVPEIPQ